jgi:Holliday junction resolvase RusA-like endonuclease
LSDWNITVPGEPAPWTVQIRNAQRTYGFYRYQAWQEEIRAYLASLWGNRPPLTGEVVIDTTFYRGWPHRAPQRQETAKKRWAEVHILRPPDVGNYRKAFLDALQPHRMWGGIIENDAQVIGGNEWKAYTYESWGYTEMTLTVGAGAGVEKGVEVLA